MATTAQPLDVIKTKIEQLDIAEAQRELSGDGDLVLLDTREPHEYAEAHLEGAVLVPPAEVMSRIEDLVPDRSQRVLLYCRTGARSARAAYQLQEARLRERRQRRRRDRGLAGPGPARRRRRGA